MNTNDQQILNELVERFALIRREMQLDENDPILRTIYFNHLEVLKTKYGQILSDILFEIHDDFCEDDQIESIEKYISKEGVEIQAEDFPGSKGKLHLRSNPLRFVATDTMTKNEVTLWAAA